MRVNGNFYHNAGQGYAIEKGKSAEGQHAVGRKDGDEKVSGGSGGSDMMVKHLGGGRFKTKSKHSDGKTTEEQHESQADLNEHMNKHFGLSEGEDLEPDNDADDDMSEDSGEALSSILG